MGNRCATPICICNSFSLARARGYNLPQSCTHLKLLNSMGLHSSNTVLDCSSWSKRHDKCCGKQINLLGALLKDSKYFFSLSSYGYKANCLFQRVSCKNVLHHRRNSLMTSSEKEKGIATSVTTEDTLIGLGFGFFNH